LILESLGFIPQLSKCLPFFIFLVPIFVLMDFRCTRLTALGNIFIITRIPNPTFTARLVNEIAKMMKHSDILSISFSDIIAKMRGTSPPEHLPEYALYQRI
jgi:hypothetical protein